MDKDTLDKLMSRIVRLEYQAETSYNERRDIQHHTNAEFVALSKRISALELAEHDKQ